MFATLVNQRLDFDPVFTTKAECVHMVGGTGCGAKVEVTEREARVHSKAWASMHPEPSWNEKAARELDKLAAKIAEDARKLRSAK